MPVKTRPATDTGRPPVTDTAGRNLAHDSKPARPKRVRKEVGSSGGVRVVEVVWGDAWLGTSDVSIKKARKLKPVKRRTVGYLVSENDDCVVLATDSYDDEGGYNAPMIIPWGWILEYYAYEVIA